jgi:phosphatidylserine/phosphatidylglycerophosphate/cardiolipin synthase-like enzyme
MNELSCLTEWTGDSPLPHLLPDPAVVFGGTRLLPSLLECVASSKGGDLLVATPFFEAPSETFEAVWHLMPHSDIDLLLKVRTLPDARRSARFLARFPWRSLRISTQKTLHAKLYAFRYADQPGGVCLVGSHNLTRAGCSRNREAGVLFIGRTSPDIQRMVDAVRAYILEETPAHDAIVVDSFSLLHRAEAA